MTTRLAKIYLLIFLLLFSFGILFIRYPNAFFQANFYAEDGDVFLQNILNNGFGSALVTPFNGYFISGLYLLTGITLFINNLLFSGFENIAQVSALVSYLFNAFVICLPVLLFYRKIKPAYLVLLVILSSFVPLSNWDYAILGTIGNLKFLFFYLTFLLVLARGWLSLKPRWIFLIDLGILISAYTVPSAYALVPFLYLRYLRDLWQKKTSLKKLLKNPAFLSSLILGIFLFSQLVFVYLNGLPELPGYLDDPYEFKKTIEIFIGRSYLYSLFFPFWDKLSDPIVIFAFLILILLTIFYTPRKHKLVYLFSFFAIFAGTFIFVWGRPGVSILFGEYKSGASGAAQFFYPQNLIFYFLIILLLQDLLDKKIQRRLTRTMIILLIAFLLCSAIPFSGSFGKINFMSQDVGTFEQNLKKACQKAASNNMSEDELITIPIYPNEKSKMEVPTAVICR